MALALANVRSLRKAEALAASHHAGALRRRAMVP